MVVRWPLLCKCMASSVRHVSLMRSCSLKPLSLAPHTSTASGSVCVSDGVSVRVRVSGGVEDT